MRKIDYPIRWMCNHLFGEAHTKTHRIVTGVFMAFGGICVAKIHVDNIVIYFIVDLIGYGLHGFGLLPLFEHFQGLASEQSVNELQTELSEVQSELSEVETSEVEEHQILTN